MTTRNLEVFRFDNLTAADRCDRCSAAALARVVKKTDGVVTAELLFCGHHLNKYSDALTNQEFIVTTRKEN